MSELQRRRGAQATRFGLTLALAAALGAGAACRHTVDPIAIEDARTAMRVKTALVNDAELGTRAIAVRVTRGVARLSGAVVSREEADRAQSLAAAVPGVVRVEADLQVRPRAREMSAAATVDPATALESDASAEPADAGLLAFGVSISPRFAGAERLAAHWSVGPLLRIGSGSGLGITVGFSWFNADLNAIGAGDSLGQMSVKPVMAGLGYTVRRGRTSLDLSAVGGLAFNTFTLNAVAPGEPVPVRVNNSLAWRPGISVWYEATRRVALNASLGYVMTRPRVVFLDGTRLDERRLRADTAILNFGVAYKLF